MREHKITLEQSILNTVNAKQDFTYNGKNDLYRYVVSLENLHTSKNPSLELEDGLTVIKDALKMINDNTLIKKDAFIINIDSIGGWHDKDTNEYYLDLNSTFVNENEALIVARAFNQLAIFDTVKNEVIRVNK